MAKPLFGGLINKLRMRTDPDFFARSCGFYPHKHWQTDALRCRDPLAAWCIHRQGGKSSCASFKASHCVLFEPGALVVVVSYVRDQARYGILKKIRPIIEEKAPELGLEYSLRQESIEIFHPGKPSSEILVVTNNEDAARAYSAIRLLVIDEASRVEDGVINGLQAALGPRGQMLMLSTPRGARGQFYVVMTTPGLPWRTVRVAADHPQAVIQSVPAMESMRMTNPRLYEQEYLLRFHGSGNALLTLDQIEACEDSNLPGFAALYAATSRPPEPQSTEAPVWFGRHTFGEI